MLGLATLALLAQIVTGPHHLTSDDIDRDGKKDEIYWSKSIMPSVPIGALSAPPTWKVEIYVKSGGQMSLAGNLLSVETLDRFWMNHKSPKRRTLVFKAVIHGITRYFGISRKFKLFEIPEETFA